MHCLSHSVRRDRLFEVPQGSCLGLVLLVIVKMHSSSVKRCMFPINSFEREDPGQLFKMFEDWTSLRAKFAIAHSSVLNPAL